MERSRVRGKLVLTGGVLGALASVAWIGETNSLDEVWWRLVPGVAVVVPFLARRSDAARRVALGLSGVLLILYSLAFPVIGSPIFFPAGVVFLLAALWVRREEQQPEADQPGA